jgi:hypothetical protein
MKNKEGSTKIITELIILGVIIAVGVLYFAIDRPTQPTAPAQNQETVPSEWQTYTNNQYGFQVNYPSGTEIRDTDATGGKSITFNFSQKAPGFDFTFPTVIITVQTEEYYNSSQLTPVTQCHPGDNPSTSTVNGIDFLKSDTSNMHGGTESAANAESYCVVRNGIRYTLEAIDMYGRCAAYSGKGGSCIQEAQAPDKATDFQRFDETIQALNFKLTSSTTIEEQKTTYTNNKFGFSLQYPISLGTPVESTDSIIFETSPGNATMDIYYLNTNYTSSTLDSIAAGKNNVRSINVDGQNGIEFSGIQFGTLVYIQLPNGKIFAINYSFANSSILDQIILPSLKFICSSGATNYPHCNAVLPFPN